MSDEDLELLVEINPGQGTVPEYRHLRDTIRHAVPGNLLIFGVGKDSRLRVEENAGGQTVFVEHEPEWIRMTREQLPDSVPIHQDTYPGPERMVLQVERLRRYRLRPDPEEAG